MPPPRSGTLYLKRQYRSSTVFLKKKKKIQTNNKNGLNRTNVGRMTLDGRLLPVLLGVEIATRDPTNGKRFFIISIYRRRPNFDLCRSAW